MQSGLRKASVRADEASGEFNRARAAPPNGNVAAGYTGAFEASVIAGLGAMPRSLECKYLYDAAGSDLFDQICDLPEYYPTRTETSILQAHAAAIAEVAGPGAELVELGSGSSLKTRLLLSAMHEPVRYTPIDISASAMRSAADDMRAHFPAVEITPLVADFSEDLALPPPVAGRRVLFFAGSTIGNFALADARAFLARLCEQVRPAAFLIGVDLDKDEPTLLRAYDDAAGVTAAFNLNLLARINRELGADFDLDAFEHEARYNRVLRRIEMHLVSRRDQTVTLAGRQFAFARGETIHTESSHKYTLDGFRQLARDAGWRTEQAWTDDAQLFSVQVLAPAG